MLIVRSLTFQEDGAVAIEYIEPAADLKSNGLQLNHVCFVPVAPDYDDGIERLMEAALDLLRDALDDADRLGPPDVDRKGRVVPDEEDEVDICPPCRHDRHDGCMGCECKH